MELRDLFAAFAMAGIIARDDNQNITGNNQHHHMPRCAEDAYKIAAYMMQERNRVWTKIDQHEREGFVNYETPTKTVPE